MKQLRALPALLMLLIVAMTSTVITAPAQAAVRDADLPSVGTVKKHFPGYKYSTRVVESNRKLEGPGATCKSSKTFTAKSGRNAVYVPTYMSDWMANPLKPLIIVEAFEFSTTTAAKSAVANFRAFAKRCKSFTDDGTRMKIAFLSIGNVGQERISFRMAGWDPEFGQINMTYAVMRKNRVISTVTTMSDKKVSGTRVAGLARAAYQAAN